ncbi:Na+/H+ antiporter [Rhizobium lusitanum]|uniref:Na+/H+ antiporter n=1 Tax=Rhizobium lusitanum TaxID=293958 RepID=A0A6L9U8L7_9HYPH|nr:Na+/H+ antiporter [Rhizobium lusitanum]NEI72275.1 Na+/H+ antiporter [Rhizobium lusitanum]
MDAFTVSLLLIASVVASSILARMSPFVLPLPFVQIALGALIASVFDFQVHLDPSTFLLFLAPLLFLDGWRTPKDGLLRDKGTIAALAFGLVIFTVIGAGYFIHWMIPAMPLAVAFALASAISPTDAVAVSAIVARVPVAKRLVHILEGESLLNDASGLVCMRFAIAAAATGYFSITQAFGAFLWVATGGICIGTLVAFLATRGKDWASRRFGEETGSQILISLLIPFGAYILAERVEASGILAAVASGIVMSYEELAGRASATTRLQRTAVWNALQFAGNGVIFVLLGEQLPTIVSGAADVVQETDHAGQLWLIGYVLAIVLALLVLRALWVWGTLGLMLLRRQDSDERFQTPTWRVVAAASLAGVRGAVTLAGVFALPLTLNDGSPFPARDLAIFLAAGVIVVSLIAANLGLPYVLAGVTALPEPMRQREEDDARIAAARAAIEAIEQRLQNMPPSQRPVDLQMEIAARVMELYRQRLENRIKTGTNTDLARSMSEIERELHLIAIRAERAELYRVAHDNNLPEELTSQLIREVDLLESRFSTL